MNVCKHLKHPICRYALWLLPMALVGCSEFLEEPIDGKRVTLLSPGRDAELDTYALDFRWEPVDFATGYHLQLATPTFDSAVYFLADTVTAAPGFTTTLPPGRYEWRVKARNGSSETPYAAYRFTLYDGDLEKQRLLLDRPASGFLTSAAEVQLSWLALYGASTYTLEVDDQQFADADAILFQQELTGITFPYRPEQEGTYHWRVRAGNAETQTAWSAVRGFTVDRTPPAAPVLQAPGNEQTVTRPVRLQWEPVGDAAAYQLYVYKADSTSLYGPDFPKRLEADAYLFDQGALGEKIVWRVRAIDGAGNTGPLSNYRTFRIQP